MRVVVTGAREGRTDVARWLTEWVKKHGRPDLTIVGCARGVDAQARQFVLERKWSHAVLYAYWDELGPVEAGRERNRRMVDLAGPGDVCLGFPGPTSRGTYHCMAYARERGLTVHELPVRG